MKTHTLLTVLPVLVLLSAYQGTSFFAHEPENDAEISSRAASFCSMMADGRYADPRNCAAYFLCVHQKGQKKFCLGGLYWDTTKKRCEWPRFVKCGNRPVPTMPSGKTCANVKCPAAKPVCRMLRGTPVCVSCVQICLPPKVPQQVCGSDGLTYRSQCQLKIDACLNNRKIIMLNSGFCAACQNVKCPAGSVCRVMFGKSMCTCKVFPVCDHRFQPVCGSDGRTYMSPCVLLATSCLTNRPIKVVKNSPCNPGCQNFVCSAGRRCIQLLNRPVCLCNRVCHSNFSPVCGSDGKTYNNVCWLQYAACVSRTPIGFLHAGTCRNCSKVKCPPGKVCQMVSHIPFCRCSTSCPAVVVPVCASDGLTYINDCHRRLKACVTGHNITVIRKGPCIDCRNVNCSLGRECKMIGNLPRCVCKTMCSAVIRRVCGSDGKTYNNVCLLQVAACTTNKYIAVINQGPCKTCRDMNCPRGKVCVMSGFRPVCVCVLKCSGAVAAVCGSDGRTYVNVCQLRVRACVTGKNITVVKQGPCLDCRNVSCPGFQECHMIRNNPVCGCNYNCPGRAPVCGSDGVSYINVCYLRLRRCVINTPITVVSKGPCPNCRPSCQNGKVCRVVNGRLVCVCDTTCTRESKPVCGSDGNTYHNLCLLRVRECQTGKRITVVRNGTCLDCRNVRCSLGRECKMIGNLPQCVCITVCPAVIRRVCGSDGKTYNNVCLLQVAACTTNTNIAVVNQGPCKSNCTNVKCPPFQECRIIANKPVCGCNYNCPGTAPVCGSDGVSYTNVCLLRLRRCIIKTPITVVSNGPCRGNCTNVKCPPFQECKIIANKPVCGCNYNCPGTAPVCGSDGVSYTNVCLLRLRRCIIKTPITVVSNGPCPNCRPPCPRGKVCRRVDNGRLACVCDTTCTRESKPVCGSDGNTYLNLCLLRVRECQTGKRITVVRNGTCLDCKTKLCPAFQVCRMIGNKPVCECNNNCPGSAPVCGSDGISYTNVCYLRLRRCLIGEPITVVNKGPCPLKCRPPCPRGKVCRRVNGRLVCVCDTTCTRESKPVCGSDGKTYHNLCLLRVRECQTGKRIIVVKNGPCIVCPECPRGKVCQIVKKKPVCVCNKICSMEYKPVCGSDGRKYLNLCLLLMRACQTGTTITVIKNGSCTGCSGVKCTRPGQVCIMVGKVPTCVCNMVCLVYYLPVCGSDGKTYPSECRLLERACTTRQNIRVVSKGRCPSSRCPPYCSRYYKPVCGSNGKTYPNRCLLNVADCLAIRRILFVHKGHCLKKPSCNGKCLKVFTPVCGTDRKTYYSLCFLTEASCRSNWALGYLHTGFCGVGPVPTCATTVCAPGTVCRVWDRQIECVCPPTCPRLFSPVCGSDGKNYTNACQLEKEACVDQSNVVVKYKRPCTYSPLCSGKPNGFYPDPESCTSFLCCIDGELTRQNCTPGFRWNDLLKVCDKGNVFCPLDPTTPPVTPTPIPRIYCYECVGSGHIPCRKRKVLCKPHEVCATLWGFSMVSKNTFITRKCLLNYFCFTACRSYQKLKMHCQIRCCSKNYCNTFQPRYKPGLFPWPGHGYVPCNKAQKRIQQLTDILKKTNALLKVVLASRNHKFYPLKYQDQMHAVNKKLKTADNPGLYVGAPDKIKLTQLRMRFQQLVKMFNDKSETKMAM